MTDTKLTSREIDRAIAEQLGWKGITGFPHDSMIAWAVPRMYGHASGDPLGSTLRLIPDWIHDLNAALSLPLPAGAHFEITIYSDGSCSVDLTGNGNKHGSAKTVVELAAAVCSCWLRHKEESGK